MEIPLPRSGLGECQTFDRAVGELDGASVTLKEVYLSPVTMMVTLERDGEIPGESGSEAWIHAFQNWYFALDGEHFAAENGYEPVVERVVLRDRRGREIPLEFRDSAMDPEAGPEVGKLPTHYIFRLTEAVDPSELRGGTLILRLGEGSCEIPLDGLRPVGE